MQSDSTTSDIKLGTAFLLILLAGLTAFWPALSGPFLFDDAPNLKKMEHGIYSLSDLLAFAFGGGSSLGRPISFLSFALNDQAWPSNPWPFKYTNLLLHLLNGVLIFVLSRKLSAFTTSSRGKTDAVALFAFALWLLHPMQLSTMMLVIQRMVELMAFFLLLGLITYLHGRVTVLHRPLTGYLWMSIGIGAGGVLSVLSKENGILLPLYALVLEGTLIPAAGIGKPKRYWSLWSGIFLLLPLAALATYFLLIADRFPAEYARREFTLAERLLTEPRILTDYLSKILVPRIGGSGLFHDDFTISTGLLSPSTTPWSIAGIAGLLFSGLFLRRRFPVLAFGILWFFAGHLLESTFVWLELYFEHRNYVPMFGPLFAGAFYLFSLPKRINAIAFASAGLLVILFLLLGWNSARVWGNNELLVKVWATENLKSFRAQQFAAKYWSDKNKYDRALYHMGVAAKYHPHHTVTHLQRLVIECSKQTTTKDYLNSLLTELSSSHHTNSLADLMRTILRLSKKEKCPPLNYEWFRKIAKTLLENDHFANYPKDKRNLYYFIGMSAAEEGLLNPAMDAMDKAYDAMPGTSIPLKQAEWLLTAGLFDDALRYIEKAKDAHISLRGRIRGKRDEIKKLESAVKEARKLGKTPKQEHPG